MWQVFMGWMPFLSPNQQQCSQPVKWPHPDLIHYWTPYLLTYLCNIWHITNSQQCLYMFRWDQEITVNSHSMMLHTSVLWHCWLRDKRPLENSTQLFTQVSQAPSGVTPDKKARSTTAQNFSMLLQHCNRWPHVANRHISGRYRQWQSKLFSWCHWQLSWPCRALWVYVQTP